MPDNMLDAPLPQDPDAWGEIAFQRFCTPAASRYRSADHHVLVERARIYLGNASTVRVPMAGADLQAYVLDPEGPGTAPRCCLCTAGPAKPRS